MCFPVCLVGVLLSGDRSNQKLALNSAVAGSLLFYVLKQLLVGP